MASDTSYIPLLATNAEMHDDNWEAGDIAQKQEFIDVHHSVKRKAYRMVYWACAVSLLCSFVNIVLVGLRVAIPQGNAFGLSQPRQLEYANAYIGLDRARRDPASPPLPPTTSFPTVLAQVNASQPKAVYEDTHHWVSTFGMIYPEDRRVLASPVDSTFIQFYAGDFGMERCTLKLLVPSRSDTDALVSDGEASIQIWRVRAERSLDVRALSYARRPPREDVFAYWTVRFNETVESPEFSCRSGMFVTFEVACAEGDKGCLVDFRQDPKKKELGFWMVQRPSI